MKATLVSTLPFSLSEPKPGLIPSLYEIPAAKYGDISTLKINDGYHLMLIPMSNDKIPPVKIIDTGEKIAQSLINDYINSKLATTYDPLPNGAVPIPGLFWLEGHINATVIKADHKTLVEQALKNTNAWFERLIKLADDDWARTRQHKTITDLQRIACKSLDLARDWNFDIFETLNNVCWACKTKINPNALVCGNCKAVLNQAEYEKRKTEFANA